MSEQQARAAINAIIQEGASTVQISQPSPIFTEPNILREELDALRQENKQLKNTLKQKDKIIATKDTAIEQLRGEIKHSEESLKAQEKKMQEEQTKIDRLSLQLEKVEQLLQRLLSKKDSKTYLNTNYLTPQSEKGATKSIKNNTQKQDFQYSQSFALGSFRSSKADLLQGKKSTSSSYGKVSNYQTEELRRYRREKLLQSQKVSDILKLQRLLPKRL